MDSRSQGERENDDGTVSSQENYKKSGSTEEDAIRIEKDTDERIEITDSSHDHDKSSSSSSSGSSSSSSSDDESREVKKIDDDNKETGDSIPEVITLSSVPIEPVPIAGDAPFMGCTANAIVENTGLLDSATPSDPKSGELVEISHVDIITSNETDENPLPKPTEIAPEVSLAADEIRQASSGETDSDVKETEGKTSPLPESNGVPEGSKESDVVISHEEEAPVRPTHGIAQRTSWLSCCGLFDVVTGSSR
ncbi:PREDICTED: suppressor protein SRP40 isoform X2 [Camelina sativa]|uniref:Suppressor protein SRP40 isoform X2 n=1 Tax=Camelina sativa TaxID=90675 RepID=A0ABM0UEB6_CAMSA|nr:PREDICTED: suppressor protein SRP40 isoform X2 [Camelina sativa]